MPCAITPLHRTYVQPYDDSRRTDVLRLGDDRGVPCQTSSGPSQVGQEFLQSQSSSIRRPYVENPTALPRQFLGSVHRSGGSGSSSAPDSRSQDRCASSGPCPRRWSRQCLKCPPARTGCARCADCSVSAIQFLKGEAGQPSKSDGSIQELPGLARPARRTRSPLACMHMPGPLTRTMVRVAGENAVLDCRFCTQNRPSERPPSLVEQGPS